MPQNNTNTPAANDTDAPVKVTQAEAPKAPGKSYIKYVGVATHRVIRPEEWPASIKHDSRPQNILLWESSNGYMVSTEKLSEDVIKVIKDQGDFIVVDASE